MVKRKIIKRVLAEEKKADNNYLIHLPTQLKKNHVFECKLSLASHYKDASKNIISFLNENEMEQLVQQTQFGNLIRFYEDYNNSNQLLWYLINRQVFDSGSDEFWMVVCKRPVRFSILEYCLITGLNCSKLYPAIPEAAGFGLRHFGGRHKIFLHDLEAKMREIGNVGGEEVNMEKLKLVSLYFVTAVLGPRKVKKDILVHPDWIRLVDEFDSFNKYPWGRLGFTEALDGLLKDLTKKYNNLIHRREDEQRCREWGSLNISGFIQPLQILAYECFPSVGDVFATRKEGSNIPIPRMFRWVTKKWSMNHAPSMNEVTKAFNDCLIEDTVGILTPTTEELLSAHYLSGDFADSAPDVVTVRIVELLSQGVTVVCSQRPLRPSTEQRPPSPTHTSPPSSSHLRPPSPTHTSPPSSSHLRPPSPTHTSPPSLSHLHPPSPTHMSPHSSSHLRPPSPPYMPPPFSSHLLPPSPLHMSTPFSSHLLPPSPPSSSHHRPTSPTHLHHPSPPDMYSVRLTILEDGLTTLRREVADGVATLRREMADGFSQMMDVMRHMQTETSGRVSMPVAEKTTCVGKVPTPIETEVHEDALMHEETEVHEDASMYEKTSGKVSVPVAEETACVERVPTPIETEVHEDASMHEETEVHEDASMYEKTSGKMSVPVAKETACVERVPTLIETEVHEDASMHEETVVHEDASMYEKTSGKVSVPVANETACVERVPTPIETEVHEDASMHDETSGKVSVPVAKETGVHEGVASSSLGKRTFEQMTDAGIPPFAEMVTAGVSNSWARAKAEMDNMMETEKKSRFFGRYDKTWFLQLATPGSLIYGNHIKECSRGLLDLQKNYPFIMAHDTSLMDVFFYQQVTSAFNDDRPSQLDILMPYARGESPDWPSVSWQVATLILVPLQISGHWVLLKFVPTIRTVIVLDSDRSLDPNCKLLKQVMKPLIRIIPRLLHALGVINELESSWDIVRPNEYPTQKISGECGAYVIAAAASTLAGENVYHVLNDDRIAEFRQFFTYSVWDHIWSLF